MRHQKAGRKLSRTSSHRRAMFSNMVSSLMLHGRIETTMPKAKELKRLADRTISWGKQVGELTARGHDKLDAPERARVVHAMRMAGRVIKSSDALEKLFREIAPRLADRPGGYTRILKTRIRRGDATAMGYVEIVDGEGPKVVKAEPEKKAKKKESKAPEAKASPKKAKKKSPEAES